MSKNTSTAVTNRAMTTRTLTVCALMAALSIVLARLFGAMPNEFTRFSLEQIPLFIAGMLCGPLAGGLVGFAADFVGCLFSGYGYNPLFCIPPILYGVCAGLFRQLLARKTMIEVTRMPRKTQLIFTTVDTPKTGLFRLALAWLPPVILGSILYQSASLAWVYGEGAFWANFIVRLVSRSVQFSVTYVLDVLCVWLLCRSNVFAATKLWPPVKFKKEDIQK